MKFDVIIPAYNEMESLPFTLHPLQTLREDLSKAGDAQETSSQMKETPSPKERERERARLLSKTLRALDVEIRRVIVVDNASEDQTAEVAMNYGAEVVYCHQRGYGSACLRGLDLLYHDPPDGVIFMDADGADDPNDLPTLLTPLIQDQMDLVIGSRIERAEEGSLTPVQRFGNSLSCFLIRALFFVDYTDLGPFRSIKWEALMFLKMSDPNFGWTVEMQAKAACRQLKVLEVPVHYRRRYAGESKISGQLKGSIQAGIKILWTIGRERLRSLKIWGSSSIK